MRYLLIALVCVCLVELILLVRLTGVKKVGCIRINTSDPEKDIYSLELEVPFGELDRRKKVIFEILHD